MWKCDIYFVLLLPHIVLNRLGVSSKKLSSTLMIWKNTNIIFGVFENTTTLAINVEGLLLQFHKKMGSEYIALNVNHSWGILRIMLFDNYLMLLLGNRIYLLFKSLVIISMLTSVDLYQTFAEEPRVKMTSVLDKIISKLSLFRF